MADNIKAPVIDNPELIDRVIGDIQKGLVKNIGWLDRAFGRAERLVKMVNNKKYFTPNVYAGGNNYIPVAPDSKIGNFSFFWIDDPQNVIWIPNQQGEIKAPFALIFWFDLRRVYNDANNRNKEALKAQILRELNGGIQLKKGRIAISRIYDLSENIYRGFSLDEVDNQFLMHPYGGFRFEGIMQIEEPCL